MRHPIQAVSFPQLFTGVFGGIPSSDFGVFLPQPSSDSLMSRLRLRPRGFIPDIAFGREPSNSTGGTFIRVDASFSSARPSSAVQKVFLLILNNLRYFSAVFPHYISHRFLNGLVDGAPSGSAVPRHGLFKHRLP